ncbi:peptidase domain-containing ABC transporter [Chamaesiphon sp. VAR_69_metabat_338]|uniref:peptidase domain-containing ABC transporter n=1 Tax=Chamaesiphon sp. VAR_69_metabat_338 TaxID=2964704 RepID=UPI00286DD80D|nr:peptidase domain-containing ABC transporter [Chamaesiphon sp. VAR_69_metabat_338]
MKAKIVRQQNEEDCGAACLATVAKHHGRTFAIGRVRTAVGTGARGTTLLGLRRGAEALGFNARPVQATPQLIENLDAAPLPAIIHWQGNHWVVLYGQKRQKYTIGDPGTGMRDVTHQELVTNWSNGILLLLEPDPGRFSEQPEDKVGGFGMFLQRVLPYKGIILQAIAINIVVGLLALTLPIVMQILTDDVLVRGDRQLLMTVGTAVIALNLFRSVIGLIQANLIAHFGQRLKLGLNLDYGFKLLRLPLTYFDAHRSGEVVSRLADVRQIHNLVSQLVLGLPSQFFIALVSLGLMLVYSVHLTVAALAAFIAIIVINLLFLPSLQQKTRRLMAESAENQGFLVETFRGAMVLKTSQATPQAWSEYQRNFGRLANLEWGATQLEIYTSTITQAIGSLTSIGLLWLGSYLVIDRTLSIGQLIAFTGMSGNLFSFLSMLVGLIDEFITAQIVVERLGEVLDTPVEEDLDRPKPRVRISATKGITCHNLNFHHAGRVALLKDFNLSIPGGAVTALVGRSGCGKSTLTKLITGLYPVQSGNIRYGKYSQSDISLECLRQQVVLVPQTPQFWSRSIVENFQLTNPEVAFEDIVMACEIACADGFIVELPDKYHTVLGEFGANLSGGQLQRLAIARAIVSNPPILILDESTAALDPALEAEVLDRLLSYRHSKTTILIAHRPAVIRRADLVVLLDRGELKLTGSPAELSRVPGEHLDFLNS